MEIALAVISLSTVAGRAGSKIWTLSEEWRDAPADLTNLRDDVTAAERFFGEIHQHVNNTSRAFGPRNVPSNSQLVEPPPFCGDALPASTIQSELERLVDEGTVVLRRIEDIIDRLAVPEIISGDYPRDKVPDMGKRRKLRWLGVSGKVARLRKELAHTRASICQLLISQNMFLSANLSASLEWSQNEVFSQITNLGARVEASHSKLAAHIDDRMHDMEKRAMLTGAQVQALARRIEMGKMGPRHPASTIKGSPIHEPYDPHDPLARLRNDIGGRRDSLCDITCACACHRVTSYVWNMTLLRSLVGVMAVAYTSWTSTLCTNPNCRDGPRGRAVRDVYLTYHLPDWLARTSLSAFFTNNLNGAPQMSIRVYYRRELERSGLATIVATGNLEAVKSRIRRGSISIHDLCGESMYPMLWLAYTSGNKINNHSITKLLLQTGADPFQRLDHLRGRSIISVVFDDFLARPDDPHQLASLFPIRRFIEESDFTLLHLAVLGIAHVDLAKVLQDPAHAGQVDAREGDGFTALHFATIRGNTHAARLLIRSGADVEARTLTGTVPLRLAARYNQFDVARVLLEAGADVHAQDAYGVQPIHAAASFERGDNTRMLALLVKYGARVDTNTSWCPPLVFALGRGNTHAVRFLLENGADPDSGYDGGVGLFAALFGPRANVELLLAHGVKINVMEKDNNLLHALAHYGTAENILQFVGREFEGVISTSLKNNDGKTPLNLLNDRNPGPEVREAFERLLDSVERQNRINSAPAGVLDDDVSALSSDDEFFDAEDGTHFLGLKAKKDQC